MVSHTFPPDNTIHILSINISNMIHLDSFVFATLLGDHYKSIQQEFCSNYTYYLLLVNSHPRNISHDLSFSMNSRSYVHLKFEKWTNILKLIAIID